MSQNDQMLTVEEVLELPAGDAQNATWINPGLKAVVREITERLTRENKKFYPVVLGSTTGGALIGCSFFTSPRFNEGDLIEIFGKGLRRTEYQGNAQVSLGKETEVHVIGRGMNAQAAHSEPPRQPAAMRDVLADTTSIATPVFGATVGMASNQAFELFRFMYTPEEMREMVKTPPFWSALHEVMSDIIRVCRLCEHGKLAPSIRDRINPPAAPAQQPPARTAQPPQTSGRADPPPHQPKPIAGPGGSVALPQSTENDDDIPF